MSGLNVEDVLAAECARQGVRATGPAARCMFMEASGRLTGQGLIELPAGTISVTDFVQSYRTMMTENFVDLAAERTKERLASVSAPSKPAKRNLTQEMAEEIRRLRSQGLPIR